MKQLLLFLIVLFVFPFSMDVDAGGPPLTKKFLNMYTVYESDFRKRGASDDVFLWASCDLGDIAISGGYSIGGGGLGSPNGAINEITINSTGLGVFLQDAELYPDAPPDSYFVGAVSSPDFPELSRVWVLHVSVNCVHNQHPHDGKY